MEITVNEILWRFAEFTPIGVVFALFSHSDSKGFLFHDSPDDLLRHGYSFVFKKLVDLPIAVNIPVVMEQPDDFVPYLTIFILCP